MLLLTYIVIKGSLPMSTLQSDPRGVSKGAKGGVALITPPQREDSASRELKSQKIVRNLLLWSKSAEAQSVGRRRIVASILGLP
jgi:hypothetical protein